MKRTAFFISDGTGITAETLGRSLLAQFENIEFQHITRPYIDTPEKAQALTEQINKAAAQDDARPIIIDTIVDQSIRDIISNCNGFMVDVFSTYLSPLEQELHAHSSYTVGKSHSIIADQSYKERIDSVHYALDNDDGARTRHYDKADIILIGASRSGKTPTCLYLALQFGVRAANYPLTEDDLDDIRLPKCLLPYKHKLFGLTIEPERLVAIRNERRPNSRYASMRQCEFEIRGVESLYRRHGIPFINTTHFSIEEISTRMMAEAGIERRFK